MASQESKANLLNTSKVESNRVSSKNRKEKSKQKKEAQIKRNLETQVKKEPEAKIKQEPLVQTKKETEAKIKQEPLLQTEKETEAKIKQEPLVQTEKEPEAQNKQKPETPIKEPESPLKEPETPPKEPESPLKEPESLLKEPELPLKKPELPLKQPESPSQQPQLPSQQPQLPLKEPVATIKEPVATIKEPVATIKEPESTIKEPETPVKEPEPPLKEPEPLLKEPETKLVAQIKKENDMQIKKVPEPHLKQESQTTNISLDDIDEDNDVDLSAIQIASSLLDKTFALDDPEFDMPEGNNEAYKNLMGLCSSSTENIKKSIYEILNSREKDDITEEDTATVLQESLNKKMEDFKKVISGCMDNDNTQATCSKLESIEQTIDESAEDFSVGKEESVDDKQVDSSNVDSAKLTNENSENLPSPSVSTDLNSEEQSKNNSATTPKSKTNKAAKGKSKNTNSNADTSIVAAKIDDAPAEINAKSTKVIEKKSEIVADSPSSNIKSPLSSILETRKSEREVLRNSISPDDERFARKQRNVAAKKKGEKTYDQILKSLGNGTAEEKLHLLCKKHVEALDEFRLMEPRLKQLERQYLIQQRERESSQAELNRMILAKSRLEGLCREMQRQSRAVKEESLLRIKEEEEKRRDIANKFQATLNDISSLMQENSKKNIQLREENAQLATKLKGLVDNYEIWEQNMSKVVQQKELETQLAKAKHAKVNLLLKQETEKFLREKQSLLENLSELQKRCTVLTSNELQLRTELSDYTSKYEEFQSVLSNSSKVFSTFKNDMETTSKKIKKLEKETNVYKQKWESSNKALLDMISHKDKQDKDFSNAQQRILTLEKLCRALQAERNELQNQISIYSSNSVPTNNADVPPLATEAGVV